MTKLFQECDEVLSIERDSIELCSVGGWSIGLETLYYTTMDGNYLTSGDLALIENRRGFDGDCHRRGTGMAATGIGLGAGLGGAALIGALVIGWGINQASKARAKAAEQANNLLSNNMNQLVQMSIAEKQSRETAIYNERASRETWQNYHAPSTVQYVDVRSGAGAFAGAGSNAWAQAEANLVSGALTGQYARCPQEVTLVSKRNCPCPDECNQ